MTSMTVILCLGSNRVVISTWTPANGRDLNTFQLKAKGRDDTRYSILCEKGKIKLGLVNIFNFNYLNYHH